MTANELGERLIQLGRLLQDENAPLEQISAAAHALGWRMHIAIVPTRQTEEAQESGDAD